MIRQGLCRTIKESSKLYPKDGGYGEWPLCSSVCPREEPYYITLYGFSRNFGVFLHLQLSSLFNTHLLWGVFFRPLLKSQLNSTCCLVKTLLPSQQPLDVPLTTNLQEKSAKQFLAVQTKARMPRMQALEPSDVWVISTCLWAMFPGVARSLIHLMNMAAFL